MLTTSRRIRSIVNGCRTEADVQMALRSHKIRYGFAVDTGYLSIVIPCLSGKVRVYRCASKSRPFNVMPVRPTDTLTHSPRHERS